MRLIVETLLIVLMLIPPGTAFAQAPNGGNPPTTRVPLCLQFPDKKVYIPCTGVVPVDTSTGNPLEWDSIGKGTPSKPNYSTPVVNALPVDSSNPLPVTCTNCTGGGGGGTGVAGETTRRAFWSETTTPLNANATFTGQSRDNGGSISGTPSRWNSFACFGYSDQTAMVVMQASNNGSTWFPVQTKTVSPGGGSVYLGQPMFTKFWRCQMVNGGTDQTMLVINSAFGM